jgi:hypothetical protein
MGTSARIEPHSDRWRLVARRLEETVQETGCTNDGSILLEEELEDRKRGRALYDSRDLAGTDARTNEFDPGISDKPLKPGIGSVSRCDPLPVVVIQNPDT